MKPLGKAIAGTIVAVGGAAALIGAGTLAVDAISAVFNAIAGVGADATGVKLAGAAVGAGAAALTGVIGALNSRWFSLKSDGAFLMGLTMTAGMAFFGGIGGWKAADFTFSDHGASAVHEQYQPRPAQRPAVSAPETPKITQ
jgi:hypothetical protein